MDQNTPPSQENMRSVPSSPNGNQDVRVAKTVNVEETSNEHWTGISGRWGKVHLKQNDHSNPCISMLAPNIFLEASTGMAQYTSDNTLTSTSRCKTAYLGDVEQYINVSNLSNIGCNHILRVNGNHSASIASDHTLKIGNKMQVIVGNGQQIDITGDKLLTIHGCIHETVQGDETREVKGSWLRYFNEKYEIATLGDVFKVMLANSIGIGIGSKISCEKSLEALLTIGKSNSLIVTVSMERVFGIKTEFKLKGYEELVAGATHEVNRVRDVRLCPYQQRVKRIIKLEKAITKMKKAALLKENSNYKSL